MRGTYERGLGLLCVFGALCFSGTVTRGQEQSQAPIANSDLGRENLSRVAASAAEIKTVLVKDSGLMVELKRWVAKDATAHGQIVSDGDLTDEAIFDRLQSDVQFRSVATTLVQRYGYLVPQVNPDSAAGKEQELLAKERVKWIAQSEQEEFEATRRQQGNRGLRSAGYCGS